MLVALVKIRKDIIKISTKKSLLLHLKSVNSSKNQVYKTLGSKEDLGWYVATVSSR